jgi:glucose/arabinose dehydrogenase
MLSRLPLCLALVAVLVTACTDASGSGDVGPPLLPVTVVEAFPGLTFEKPTGMYEVPDGSGRFVVLEQEGRILLIDGNAVSVFLDISGVIKPEGTLNSEEGLLGFAFAPDFATSGVAYVNYTRPRPQRTVLSRFTLDAATGVLDPQSVEVILEIDQPFWNHNGGGIAFGPDGYLYVGRGDGGFGGEPNPDNSAQDLGSLRGKILRLDVSGGDEGYRIPPDNPFVNEASARPEVWAYGLRNPWRFAFDHATGDLWAGDAGHERYEEIDIILPGLNYGWKVMEGHACMDGGCDKAGLTPPVIDYDHDGGNCVVVGGLVYRGSALPLDGVYVYGDFCSGRIFGLRYEAGEVVQSDELADTELMITSFASDSAGNLYILSRGSRDQPGAVYRVVLGE